MNKITATLHVFFENPFWVGVFERTEGGMLSACKITFGAEPKDCEIYKFILKHYAQLRFSPAVTVTTEKTMSNPKRIQREVQKQLNHIGIGTKSQQALKQQREQMKTDRKTKRREQKIAEQQRIFALKQQKRKEKHRGH